MDFLQQKSLGHQDVKHNKRGLLNPPRVKGLLLLLCSFGFFLPTHAQTQASSPTPKPVKVQVPGEGAGILRPLDFIENKGQWGTEHDIRFKADVPSGVFYLTGSGMAYDFVDVGEFEKYQQMYHDGKDLSGLYYNKHFYKVNFVGANSGNTVKSEGSQKRSYYHNYFIDNDQSRWKGHVGLYGRAELKNVYDGIDFVAFSPEKLGSAHLEYDFIVAPGADASQIKLAFDGVHPKLDKEGNLIIKTSVNELVEQAPYCYQIIDGQKVEVASKFVLQEGALSFAFPEGYNEAYELIIDPAQLIYATFSGGGGTTAYYAHCTTFDEAGNTYAQGLITTSSPTGSQWPLTTGAYQTSVVASSNGHPCINKYSTDGSTLLYSTYFAASGGAVVINTMRVDKNNDLVVGGTTNAASFPTSAGAFQTTLAGGNDLFISRLSEDGSTLMHSTLLGGSLHEGSRPVNGGWGASYTGLGSATDPINPTEVTFDGNGNVWVTSNSGSSNFPVTPNAAQGTFAGGACDAVVACLSYALDTLIYGTYLGGASNEGGIGIEINEINDALYVVGKTTSTDFPVDTGAFLSTFQGGEDGFVVKINRNTGALVNASYLGTTGNDDAERVAFDVAGNVYVAGRNQSGNYPIPAGRWQAPGNSGKIYVQKLTEDLSTGLAASKLGGTSNNIIASGFLVDDCGNVVVGTVGSGSQSGQELTADAFETQNRPFYLCIIDVSFDSIIFGSYFGSTSDHFHPATSRVDPNGIYYQSVCTTSGTFPSTPAAAFPVKLNGGTNDVATFKFKFPPVGVIANINTFISPQSKDSGCAPYTLELGNNSSSPYGMWFEWDPGDGSPIISTPGFSHTYTTPGVYTVRLDAYSDSACIKHDFDTFVVTVVKVEPPVISVSPDTLVCSDNLVLKLWVNVDNWNNNMTIQWSPNTGIVSGANSDTVYVSSGTRSYYVRVRDTVPNLCGFSAYDTVNIEYFPRALNILTPDTTVCKGQQVHIRAESAPGYTFLWGPTNGVSDSLILSPIISGNRTETYTLTAHHEGCVDTAQMITITVEDYPNVELGNDKEVCQWTDVLLSSNVSPYRNDYRYTWSPSGNLENIHGPNTRFVADNNTSGWYYLDVVSPVGCAGRDSVHVTVFPGNFAAFGPDTGFCLSDANGAEIWAANGASYQWVPSTGLSDDAISNPIANPTASTLYTVYVTDVHGCLDTGEVMVDIYPEAVLNLPDSVNIYSGEQYHLEPPTNCIYFTWFPTNGINSTLVSDPVFYPEVRTRYFVEARTENGCALKDSIDILVKETVLDPPNAFVPRSGDQKTAFKIERRGIAQLKEFSIYNRWGNKVFSTTDITKGWDGTYNGKPQSMGVYVYVIDAITDSGKTIHKTGNVTLIR